MTQSLCLFVDNRINNSLQDGSPANLLIAFAKVGPSMSSIVVKASTHLVIMSQLSLVWSHWYKYFGLVHNPFFYDLRSFRRRFSKCVVHIHCHLIKTPLSNGTHDFRGNAYGRTRTSISRIGYIQTH